MEEKLYGTVCKITYYNEENGFGIVRITLDYKDKVIAKYKAKLFTNLLTVTCNFDRIPYIDEEFDFVGDFITNQYGIQFKATSFSRRNENTLEGVVAYLSSELFMHVGKVAATKIYNTLGKDCLTKIIASKEALDKVEGLTELQKNTIYTKLVEDSQNKNATVNLINIGMTMPMARKLISYLGYDADKIVKENPYKLIDIVDNFGFLKADKIALNCGIKEDSDVRLEALIVYTLTMSTYQTGDCYINRSELYDKTAMIINREKDILNNENFERVLSSLKYEKRIVIDENNDIYDSHISYSEDYLASKLQEFLKGKAVSKAEEKKINNIIIDLEKEFQITYTEKQKEAIFKALSESIMIITGGPGTGKSTIIKGIVEGYARLKGKDNAKDTIALVAPTGRAAKRLCEVTFHPAQTIHRLLGYKGHGVYDYGPNMHITHKVLIIDEMSMVDVSLAARLFGALDSDVKIVIIGDKDQLPSVGPGDVLNDMISSKEITVVTLDKIHRQASNSSIISLAHELNQGLIPENILEKQNDRNFITMYDNMIMANIKKTIHQALNRGMDLVKDIQVLVPLYKGEIGINAINNSLQEEFNPKTDEEISHFGRYFRINDKVIQLVNRSEKNVMNGDIGYIWSFNYEGEKITGVNVMYDFGSVSYSHEELEDLNHAYAISIHKAQGSEFELVIVPFSYKYYIMLKRKLIYTAITRAKKFLIMLGNVEALCRGVQGIEEKRKTKLCEKIRFSNGDGKILEEELDESEEKMENISPYDFL